MKKLRKILENPPHQDKPRLQREYCLNCQLNVPPIDYPKWQQQIHKGVAEAMLNGDITEFCLGQKTPPMASRGCLSF